MKDIQLFLCILVNTQYVFKNLHLISNIDIANKGARNSELDLIQVYCLVTEKPMDLILPGFPITMILRDKLNFHNLILF